MYQPIRAGTDRYKSVRTGTKFETKQEYINFVELSKRNVPTDTTNTETELITMILSSHITMIRNWKVSTPKFHSKTPVSPNPKKPNE